MIWFYWICSLWKPFLLTDQLHLITSQEKEHHPFSQLAHSLKWCDLFQTRKKKKVLLVKFILKPQGPSHLTVSSSPTKPGTYMRGNDIMPHGWRRNCFKKPVPGVSWFTVSVDQNMTSLLRKHTQFRTWKCPRKDLWDPSVNWKTIQESESGSVDGPIQYLFPWIQHRDLYNSQGNLNRFVYILEKKSIHQVTGKRTQCCSTRVLFLIIP